MPDPLLYLKAMAASAIVSAFVVLAMAGLRRPGSDLTLRLASVLAIAIGLAVGYWVLALNLAWPPRNGLDRLLLIVLPAGLVVETIAAFSCVPGKMAWGLRAGISLAVPRVLLHDSVYLSRTEHNLALWQLITALVVGGILLAGVWSLMLWHSKRLPGTSIPISLCLAIQSAGIAIMLGGYIKGGAAAIPLAATIIGVSVASAIASRWFHESKFVNSSAAIGIGVVGLYGLVFIGRFFGRLSTEGTLVMLLAPLLCWVAELPIVRQRKPWIVESLRIAVVSIPLVIVLVLAKHDFDQKMAPLLGNAIPSIAGTPPL